MLDVPIYDKYSRCKYVSLSLCETTKQMQSAAALFETLKCSNKVIHINMRINFIRESILEELFSIHFVPTHYNVADVLTKALPVAQFTHLRSILMLGCGGKEPAWTSDPAAATFEDQLHLGLTAHMSRVM